MHCQKCGNKLEEESNFCKLCGNNITGILPKLPATAWQRLANLILDSIGVFIFGFFIGIIFGLIGASKVPFFISLSLGLLYLIISEYIWQRSPAKWITKTKVVNRDGTKPSLLKIVGRTFARWIPMESLSFLVNSNPEGWHDRISGTLVVPAEYTEEDVKSIDLPSLRKSNSIILVIVITVVIIIILGILASVVLAGLSSARIKGKDALIKSAISQSMVEAEIYNNNNGTTGYKNFCSISKALNTIEAKYNIKFICNDSEANYAISAKLNSGKNFCLDSKSKTISETDVELSNYSLQCPTQLTFTNNK